MSLTRPAGRSGRLRRATRLGLPLVATAVLAGGCTGNPIDEFPRFGFPVPVTDQGENILRLWQGTTIASLVVGALVWGLIFWSVIAFRKRAGDDEMPQQVRYNLPIEAVYTIIPVIIIGVLFFYTAKSETYVDKLSDNPDVTVGVVGFRWGWQFNYDNGTKTAADDVQITSTVDRDPVLVLPTDRTILFNETSPDVIHSFWVPKFLFKRDVVPGRVNKFELTINEQGTFVGHCAEFCGTNHDRMNFTVKAVSPDEYAAFLRKNAGTNNGDPIDNARPITSNTLSEDSVSANSGSAQ